MFQVEIPLLRIDITLTLSEGSSLRAEGSPVQIDITAIYVEGSLLRIEGSLKRADFNLTHVKGSPEHIDLSGGNSDGNARYIYVSKRCIQCSPHFIGWLSGIIMSFMVLLMGEKYLMVGIVL